MCSVQKGVMPTENKRRSSRGFQTLMLGLRLRVLHGTKKLTLTRQDSTIVLRNHRTRNRSSCKLSPNPNRAFSNTKNQSSNKKCGTKNYRPNNKRFVSMRSKRPRLMQLKWPRRSVSSRSRFWKNKIRRN